MKNLIFEIKNSSFDYSLFISGFHLSEKYGYTIKEIEKDGLDNLELIHLSEEENTFSPLSFSELIKEISQRLNKIRPAVMFIFGDRVESYAATLAAHLEHIPIAHFGGGVFTQGALDNIYRYNISNLADYSFVTTSSAKEVLDSLPIVKKKIFNVGSVAIEAIMKWKDNAVSIKELLPELVIGQFVLITFHSVTFYNEDVAKVLEESVKTILRHGDQVLLTYPNGDIGSEPIVETIERLRNVNGVFVVKSLGAKYYYAALQDCRFVLGNSSSGIIEAPYFDKMVVNVGKRQEGRISEDHIIHVPSDPDSVIQEINKLYEGNAQDPRNSCIYGEGNTCEKVVQILEEELNAV